MIVPRTPVTMSRGMERGILSIFVAASAVVALAFILPATRQIVEIMSGQAQVNLLTSANVPHDASDAAPTIVSATFETPWVAATGLSDAARGLLAAGVGFGALTAAATAAAIAYFFLLLMWKRPFHWSLIVAAQIAGSSLLIGGLLSGGLGGFGRAMAADELNPLADDVFVIGFSFEPAVLLAGIAVLALSLVFAYGTTLKRDTEGLV